MENKTDFFLRIIEIFASVQGETSFSGLPTTFIRLAGCPLRCVWCDTTYSFGKGEKMSSEEILGIVKKNGHKYICVTGGEPLAQEKVLFLMQMICNEGFIVSLETSGALPIEKVDKRVHIILDIKCPDSKMDHKNLFENLKFLEKKDEIKFVINSRKDYEYAKEICQKFELFNKSSPLLFSPVFENLDAKVLVNWILDDKLPVRLNMQIHKFIWSPLAKGV